MNSLSRFDRSDNRISNITLLSGLVTLSVAFFVVGPKPGSVHTAASFPVATSNRPHAGPEVVVALTNVNGPATSALLLSNSGNTDSTEDAPPEVLPNEPTPDQQVVAHVIRSGETLFNIWKLYGAPKLGSSKAAEAWKEAGVSLSTLRPGDELQLVLENGDVAEVRRKLRNGDEITLRGDSKNGYKASWKRVLSVERERTASGFISTSFSEAAQNAAIPYPVVDELVDLFANRVEFRRDLHPGDSFTVTYRELVREGTQASAPDEPILAASITRGGKMLAVIRHASKGGEARYYTEDGEVVGDYFLRYPVQFSRVSSVFSNARLHPVLQRLRPHNGVDFAAPVGTPVRAAADGVIEDAGYRGGAGNMIKIAHGPRYTTAYLHLSKIAKEVRNGERVKRGQVIGAVGMTGLASGPHLHFSLYDRGAYVDPLSASIPTLHNGEDRIPKQVLLAALESLHLSRQQLVLAAAEPRDGKTQKVG